MNVQNSEKLNENKVIGVDNSQKHTDKTFNSSDFVSLGASL